MTSQPPSGRKLERERSKGLADEVQSMAAAEIDWAAARRSVRLLHKHPACRSFCCTSRSANHVAAEKPPSYSGLPVVGLGGDQPLLADPVVGEIVDEHHVVDAHAHFGERLRRRSEIEQQNLLLARGVKCLRRLAAGQHLLVLGRWPTGHLPLAETVQLRGRCEDAIELADIAIVHEVEVTLHCFGQLLRRGFGHSELLYGL